jgi:general secretion pathway protein G
MEAKRKTKDRRGEAGFTLVELMVVISIIAILATIVGYNVITSMDDASVAQAKSQIRNFKTALMAYRLKFNRFPTTAEGLEALVNNEKGIKLLESNEIPKDPWGNPYVYTSDSAREYTIVSYGADGRQGGTGYDADITSALEGDSR